MYQGEQISKTFFAMQGDEVIPITDLTASLYNPKTMQEFQRFDNDGTNPSIEDLGNGYFNITVTPDITRKLPHGVEVWISISAGSIKQIFAGVFGTFYKNPLTDEL